MIKAFILIMVFTNGTSVGTLSQEFKSEETCKAAMADIKDQNQSHGQFGKISVIAANCYPK